MGEALGVSSGIAMRMPLDRFVQCWPMIQSEMDKVPHVWQPWYTKEYYYNGVLSGELQVWAAGHDGAPRLVLFTQIVFYPAAKVFRGILMLGNSLDESIDAMWAALEQFARENECARVEVLGRRGWERKLARFGLRPVGVLLSGSVSQLKVQ